MTYKTPEERAEYARNWRVKHPKKAKAIDAKHRAKQPAGAATLRMRKWRAANPERAKASAAAQNKRWREENREKRKAYEARYRDANRDRLRAKWKRWAEQDRLAHPEHYRERHLKRLYGLTQSQYDEMASKQKHKCASCGSPAKKEKHGVLGVDHCHKTGRVRGLLCSKCNMIIGQADDNVELIQRWADYLGGKLPFQQQV